MSHIPTVSSQHIVSKISRTFKPSDSNWINDCLEDIGWAIQAIGYHAGFIDKATEPPYIKVENHRGKIPCDVERILHVEQLKIFRKNSNILNPDGTTPIPEEDENTCEYKGTKMILSSDTYLASISSSTPSTRSANYSLLENTYQINGDYVVTGFEKGLIKLIYKAFPVDDDGMPLVINDFDYKSCLEFYCISQMILRGFVHHVLDYKTAFSHFEMYLPRAENAVKVMTLDRAERFEASWNRYIRSVNFSGSYYAGLEQTEQIAR